ncbi:TPA: hypothetical protein JG832_002498 [Enterobacter hormaechei subsp. xiangfangensis]|nr:hypothetical protein [Enterobacter hormaechei subsp. xiangfangensis]HAV1890633.1 hypothetical protein [Enterobacter hormaechei subsp. xiangfangensis]
MQKIPRAIGKASGVAVGETNSSGTLSVEGGGLSVFAGLVTTRRGKPFTVLAVNKNTYRDILGAAFHPNEQPNHFEPMRHLNQALNGGPGYIVRVVPSNMEIPYIKISTPGNSNQPATPVNIDPVLSVFTIFPGNIVGDGQTAVVITFTPKDQYGNAVKGLTHISFDVTGVNLSIGKVTEANGVYTASATGIIPGKALIRPLVANKAVGNLSAQLTVDQMPNQIATMDPDKCEYWLSNNRVYANGSSTITLYLQLRDTEGQPLSIQESRVSFVGLGNIDVTITQATEDLTIAGLYTAKLSGSKVGSITIVPTVDGGLIGNNKGELVYLDKAPVQDDQASEIDGYQSAISVDKNSIVANDTDSVVVTFTARNAAGSLMPGLANKLSLAIYNLTGVSKTPIVETTAGVYETTLTVARSSVGDRAEIHVLHNGYTVDRVTAMLNVDRIKPQLPIVDTTASSFTASASQAFATGGKGQDSIVTLTLTLVDTQGQAMSNRAVTFDILGAANTGAIREEHPGVYEVDVFSYQVSNVNVVPMLDGLKVDNFSVDIAFVQAPVKVPVVDAVRSAKTLTISPATIPADNVTPARITIQVVDDQGDSMGGLEAQLGLDTNIPGVDFTDFLEGARGFYTATAVSDTEGVYIVTPTLNGSDMGATTRTLTVTKVVNNPDPSKSKVEIAPGIINDDGSHTATLTLTLKNSSGRLITGVESRVGFEPDDMQYVSITQATETTPGVYTAIVTGKSVKGSVVIRPQYDGANIGNRSVTLVLNDPSTVAPPVAADLTGSTFTVDVNQIRSDLGETATITFVAMDKNGDPVTDALLPHLIFKPAKTTGYSVSPIASHNNGTYTATVTATSNTSSGDIVIDAMYDSKQIQVVDGSGMKDLEVAIQMVGAVDENMSVLELSQGDIDADGVETAIVYFAPQDANGLIIQGADVDFTFSGVNSAALVKGTPATVNGVTSVTLTSSMPGAITISVTVDGVALANVVKTLTVNSIVDDATSTLTANPKSVEGNGTDQTTLTLTVKDKKGAGMAGLANNVILTGNDGTSDVDMSGVTLSDGGNGVYTAKFGLAVTADTVVTFKAVVYGAELSGVSEAVTFTKPAAPVPTTPETGDSSFTSSLPSGQDAPTDGSVVTFTATLKNGSTVITGRNVVLVTTPQALSTTTVSSMVENPPASGIYVGTIKASADDEFDVGITVDGNAFAIPVIHTKFATPTVTPVTPTDPVIGDSSFASDQTSGTPVEADGVAKITLTLALKNGSTAITGKDVKFVGASKKATTTIGDATETNGVYTAEITATEDDSFDVTVTVDGADFGITAVPVTFHKTPVVPPTPTDPVVGDSTFASDQTSGTPAVADGAAKVKLTLTLKNGTTAITGKDVKFVAATKKTTTTIGNVTEANGVYSADVTATEDDTFAVTVTIGGVAFGVTAVDVEFKKPAPAVPTEPTAKDSTLTADKTTAEADDKAEIELTLTLLNGATPISGKTVTFEGGKNTTTITPETPAGNVYKAKVKASAADAFDVVVKVGGTALAITPAVHIAFTAPATPVTPPAPAAGTPDTTKSTIKGNWAAAGVAENDPVEFTVVLADSTGKAITGQAAKLKLYDNTAKAEVAGVTFTEDATTKGTYTAQTSAKKPASGDTVDYVFEYDGAVVAVTPATVKVN